MANVYGHRKCKSVVEVPPKAAYDVHAHGNINRDGKITGATGQALVHTDDEGKVVASNTLNADLTVNGAIVATKVIGAVYA